MPKTDKPILTERFDEAMSLALKIHRNQTRKSRGGQIPYMNHLLTVCGMVLELNGTEDEAIAAILHDSVEDQAANFAEFARCWEGAPARPDIFTDEQVCFAYINMRFGENVEALIRSLTDEKLDKGWKALPLARRMAFIDESREAKYKKLRVAPDSVRKIKACDALHNLRSLLQDYMQSGPDVFRNFVAGQDGTIRYYENLARIFAEYGPSLASIEMNIVLNRLKRHIAADEV